MKMSTLSKLGFWRPSLIVGILALAVISEPAARTNKPAGPHNGSNWMAAYAAEAVMIDRAARDFKLPEEIEWKSRPGSTSQTALLFGDPSKPGLYAQLLKRGPNDWSQPHSHPNDRIIHVLAGTMWIGTGAKLDRENTVALKPGSYARDIANQVHYDGTGPEGITIEIIGMGPATSTPAAR